MGMLGKTAILHLRPQWIAVAVHDAENPEYSILKQRLARRLKNDGKSEKDLNLVELTKVRRLPR